LAIKNLVILTYSIKRGGLLSKNMLQNKRTS